MAWPLEISNLLVRTDRGRTLLSVPNLRVSAGAAIGVRGPSGAGKSTFLSALSGLSDGASGRVDWGGTDVLSLDASASAAFRAANMGLIFQDFLLFDELDAIGNAAVKSLFAPARDRRDLHSAAGEILTSLGVRETAGRDVTLYSGGERQRIAVARALSSKPGIILADEPTANLHRDAADALGHDLLNLTRNGGATLIVVSHDPALLDRMDRIIDIADGCVVGDS